MRCPKCGGNLLANENQFVCEECKAVFRKKAPANPQVKSGIPPHVGTAPARAEVKVPTEQSPFNAAAKEKAVQPEPVILPDKLEEAVQSEPVILSDKLEEAPAESAPDNANQNEIDELKARLAEMEKKQAQLEGKGKGQKVSTDSVKRLWEKFKESKVFDFLKKWGLKVVLPSTLVVLTAIILMTCLIGVRGVYYNVDNPNEFINFTATRYTYYGDLDGIEYVTEGTWKTKNGKLYLSYNDEGRLSIHGLVRRTLRIQEQRIQTL